VAQARPPGTAPGRLDRNISFAGAVYNVGRAFSGGMVEVFTIDGVVCVALDGKIVKRHGARHTPEQEEAALRRKRPMVRLAQRTGRTLAAQEVGP
jgi:hypothetical protein